MKQEEKNINTKKSQTVLTLQILWLKRYVHFNPVPPVRRLWMERMVLDVWVDQQRSLTFNGSYEKALRKGDADHFCLTAKKQENLISTLSCAKFTTPSSTVFQTM